MKCDIFLRTCSKKGVLNTQRCVGDTRETMILKCASSLAASIKSCQHHQIKLWVVDDHSDEDFVEKLKNIFNEIDFYFETLNGTGHQDSAAAQFKLAHDHGTELIYLVEDDYFHTTSALSTMIDSYVFLNQLDEFHSTAIFPYDSVDRYHRDFPTPSRIFYLNGLYWRTIKKSTFTVLMNSVNFRNSYEMFDYLAKNYTPGELAEDQTINRLWNNMVDFGGPIILFSPIPSLAIHLETLEPTAITDGFVNWREQWDNYVIS